MQTPNIPDAETGLAKIAPLALLLYEGFEAALLEAREFFEVRELKPRHEPHLFAHLVRFFVKNWLNGKGQNVETADYELDDLALSGLRIAFEDWDLRIFKAVDAKGFDGEPLPALPPPGRSEAKQNFYQQQLGFLPTPDNSLRASTLNLVILWEVTISWNVRLFLACPKSGGNSRISVEMFWLAEIPHVIATPVAQTESPADELELENTVTATGTQKK